MRTARAISILALVAALTGSVGAQEAPKPGCSRQVTVYIDDSPPMFRPPEGKTAKPIDELRTALDKFLDFAGMTDADHLTVKAFSDDVRVVYDGPWSRDALEAARTLSGNGQRTRLDRVVADMLGIASKSGQQLFVIASDFAHDPEIGDCENLEKRAADFEARERGHVAGNPEAAKRLKTNAQATLVLIPVKNKPCNEPVVQRVLGLLHQDFNGSMVIGDSAKTIESGLRIAVNAQVDFEPAPANITEPEKGLHLTAINRAAIPVHLERVKLSVSPEAYDVAAVLAPCRETALAPLPGDLFAKLGAKDFTVTGAGEGIAEKQDASTISLKVVLIEKPEVLYYRPTLGRKTALVMTSVRSPIEQNFKFTVAGDALSATTQSYDVQLSAGENQFIFQFVAAKTTKPVAHPEVTFQAQDKTAVENADAHDTSVVAAAGTAATIEGKQAERVATANGIQLFWTLVALAVFLAYAWKVHHKRSVYGLSDAAGVFKHVSEVLLQWIVPGVFWLFNLLHDAIWHPVMQPGATTPAAWAGLICRYVLLLALIIIGVRKWFILTWGAHEVALLTDDAATELYEKRRNKMFLTMAFLAVIGGLLLYANRLPLKAASPHATPVASASPAPAP